MEEAAEDITSKPCRVTEVQCSGLERTRPEIVDRELDGLRQASTLAEIYAELQDALTSLNQLDVFAGADVAITEAKRVIPRIKTKEVALQQGGPGTCRLEIDFREKNPWTVRAKTFVQGTEAGIEGRIGLRNLRGRAERLMFSMEYGSHSMAESALEYHKPRIMGQPAHFDIRLFNHTKSNAYYTSCEERLKALSLALSSPDRLHSLIYDLGWHQLLDSHSRASPSVQAYLGHRLRSSLRYQFLYDRREARQLSSGLALRWISQLHGLYPRMPRSFQNKLDLQLSWRFLPWSSISLGAGAGLLLPIDRNFRTASTHLADRFTIGGVDSIKGFHLNCIGPSAERRPMNATPPGRDFLGGDVMAVAYASLNLFPRQMASGQMGVYAHIFGDVGNVVPLSSVASGPWRDNIKKFSGDLRASVGCGIVLPTPVGNFAVNYVLPIRHGRHDALRLGLQMSFGTEPFTA